MLTVLTFAVLAAPASPEWNRLSLPHALQRVLDDGHFEQTPGGFRAIALSHVADGCAAQMRFEKKRSAARACVEAAFAQSKALLPKSCSKGRCDAEQLLANENALALSHLLLVLGAADKTGLCLDEALHHALADGLAAASTADPLATVPSYRGASFRWPADQSALLAGLKRADDAHGWTSHVEPLAKFVAVIDSVGTHRSGLPVSELTGLGPGARMPRGCAQSYISRYFAEVDGPRAAAWWKTYRTNFVEHLPLGVIGFREWPRGVEREGDIDSGPIVLGIGVAASALAISAAKAQGDSRLAGALELSAKRAQSMGVGSLVANATFAQAIEFEGHWHPVP